MALIGAFLCIGFQFGMFVLQRIPLPPRDTIPKQDSLRIKIYMGFISIEQLLEYLH